MADSGSVVSWPDPPPGPKPPPGTRSWELVRALRRSGWLRPRRIGCALLVLVLLLLAALWVLGSTVNAITAVFREDPVAGSPFDTVTPTSPPSSGSPTIDLITRRGRLIVAIQEAPGLAERSPGSNDYTGFDVALLELVARDLGADPTDTSFKPIPASSREAVLRRGEADVALGGYEITAQRRAEVGIAGPYLVSPLRVVGEPLGGTEYGFGLPPGDEVLRERVNDVLRTAIANGTWTRLYEKYLGAPAPTPPTIR